MLERAKRLLAMLLLVVMTVTSIPAMAEGETEISPEQYAVLEEVMAEPVEETEEEPEEVEEQYEGKVPVEGPADLADSSEIDNSAVSGEEPAAETIPEPDAENTAEPVVEEAVSAEPTIEASSSPDDEIFPEDAPEASVEPSPEVTPAPEVELTPEVSIEPTLDPSIEPSVEPSAEPSVEPSTVPSAEPTMEAPAVNPPEVIVLPEWKMDGDVLVIPYTAEELTITIGWEFEGEAKEYRIQTAPVPEDENEEELLTDVCTCVETEVVLPVVDYIEGVYTLYITAVLEDGTTAVGVQKFMLALQETAIDENAPKTPQELADYFDMTLEELAEALGMTVEELEGLSKEEVCEISNIYISSPQMLATTISLTNDQIVNHANKLLGTTYTRGYCLEWMATKFWQALGASYSSHCCAYALGNDMIVSTSKVNIPVGANVYFGGSLVSHEGKLGYNHSCGHVGVYVGNNQIISLTHYLNDPSDLGVVRLNTLEQWENWGYPYRGWGYPKGVDLSTSGPTATNLKFSNVLYPKTYKISNSGWTLGSGTLESNNKLTSICSQIIRCRDGYVVSDSKEKAISGYSYVVKNLDDFSGNDNGVRFSFINEAGKYDWVLTAKDSAGRTVKLEMSFTAVTSGSTSTSTASKEYTSSGSVGSFSHVAYENCTYKITKEVTLRKKPFDAADKGSTLKAGTTITSVAVVDNGSNYWLELGGSYAGQYIFSGYSNKRVQNGNQYLQLVSDNTSVKWDGCNISGYVHTQGQSKTLSGTVTSTSTIKSIKVEIHKGSSCWGEPVSANVNGKSYSMGSLKPAFNTLPAGDYYLVLTVEYYSNRMALRVSEVKIPFMVSSGSTTVAVNSVSLNKSSLSLAKGESSTLAATVSPSNASNKSVKWSTSNSSIATVSGGKVTAVGAGTATITCTAADGSGKKATCTVQVTEKNFGYTIQAYERAVYKGDGSKNAVKALPYAGSDVRTIEDYTTKSFTVVASVKNSYGNIWYQTEQGYFIYSGDVKYVKSAAEVSIKNRTTPSANHTPGTSCELNGTVVSTDYITKLVGRVYDGSKVVLGPAVAEYTASKQYREVDIVRSQVNTGLKFSQLAAGKKYTYEILVYYGSRGLYKNFSYDFWVGKPASEVKPTSVSIRQGSKLSIPVGALVQLTTELAPSNASTTLTWSSSNTKVVTVNKTSGTVTAKKAGTAVITVKTANGKKDTLTLTVYDPNVVSSVELNYSGTLEMGLNEQMYLHASVSPSTASTMLKWSSSSKKIAEVDKYGIVTAKKVGTATITVKTANGKTDTVKVKVIDRKAPTKIELDKTGTVKLNLGEALVLRATISPITAATASKTWSSSNKKIAKVDKWGNVIPVKEGTVTITVKTENGKTDSVKVKVVDPKKPTGIKFLESGTIKLPVGTSFQLHVIMEPNGAESTLTWSSSNKRYAKVNKTGKVTAVKKGTVTITVKSANGKTDTIKVKVVE